MSLKGYLCVPARALAVAAVLALTALPAMKATPLTWLPNGFQFTDGSHLTGAITFDDATDSYTFDGLVAVGGSEYNNVPFLYQNPVLPDSTSYITLVRSLPPGGLLGVPSLWIIPDAPIDGPSGSVVLTHLAIEALCADVVCSTFSSASVSVAAYGELRAVPEGTVIPGLPTGDDGGESSAGDDGGHSSGGDDGNESGDDSPAVPEPSTALMLPGALLLLVGWKTFQRRHGRTRS